MRDMLSTGGFLDLTREEVSELAISLINTDEGSQVISGGEVLFEIANNIDVDEQRDPDRYTVFMSKTAHSGESETSQLASSRNGESLGYVFPLTSFRDAENFEGLWIKRFADVGFRFAASEDCISNFSANVTVDSLRGKRVQLDEILDDSLSIVVLGNDARARLDADEKTLELMLFREGVILLRSRDDIGSPAPQKSWNRRLNLRRPDTLVADEAAVFLTLLKSADRDRSGVGAFMHLYQALEFCIDHIFNWGVETIANSQLDTWNMKSELSQITGESYRLGILDRKCLFTMHSRASLHSLGSSCRKFLLALGMDIDDDMSWHKLLYKCRNIIVHNQIMMMKSPSLPLGDLISSLREASLEILFSFSKPEEIVSA